MIDEVVEFGAALLDHNDLDPIYNLLVESEMDKEQLNRWLLGYSMFYHAGVASMLAEREDFYDAVMEDFDSKPRCEERRHFRGDKAKKAVEFLRFNSPDFHTRYWYQGKLGDQPSTDFKSVIKRIRTYPQYGPWIAFKLADMGERCFGIPIDFSNCALHMYKEPMAGANLAIKGDEKADITEQELENLIHYVSSKLNRMGFKAPPWHDRPIGLQEIETILCKWHSFKKGHYQVGKDVKNVAGHLFWADGQFPLYKPIVSQLLHTAETLFPDGY